MLLRTYAIYRCMALNGGLWVRHIRVLVTLPALLKACHVAHSVFGGQGLAGTDYAPINVIWAQREGGVVKPRGYWHQCLASWVGLLHIDIQNVPREGAVLTQTTRWPRPNLSGKSERCWPHIPAAQIAPGKNSNPPRASHWQMH